MKIEPLGLSPDGEHMRYRVTAPVGDMLCTGRAATWCALHGNCDCPARFDDGERTLDDPNCPLHGQASAHGEPLPTLTMERLFQEVARLRQPSEQPPGVDDDEWAAMQAIAAAGYAYISPFTLDKLRHAQWDANRLADWTVGSPAVPLVGVRLIAERGWPDGVIGLPKHRITLDEADGYYQLMGKMRALWRLLP